MVVSKKQSGSAPAKDQEGGNEKKHVATAEASNRGGSSESSKSFEKDLDRILHNRFRDGSKAKKVELTATKEKEA